MAVKEHVQNWFGLYVGILLLLIGGLGVAFCPDQIGSRLSEALFITGFITAAVDPVLRRRLLKEASKDIFQHLLGFNLPLEAREALLDFVEQNRSYRANTQIDVAVTGAGRGLVDLHWTIRSELIAVAATKYKQHLSFEEAENGNIEHMSVTSLEHPERNYSLVAPTLRRNADEPMVMEWYGKEIKLKKGDVLQTYAKFKTSGPEIGFSVHNFGATTIHPSLRISPSPNFEVSASISDQRNGDEYIYQKVFVRGGHIQIRWKPKVLRPTQ
jgi:hypothetical protein